MRIRIAIMVVLLGISLPALAFEGRGILLLADDGTPEWDAQVSQLAAAVDKQRPTEVVFWSATNPNLQPAVDRLVQRGVSEIEVVPLFIAAPPSDLSSRVRSSVPLRVTAPLNGDPIVTDIILGRAQAISTNPAAEALVLISHRSPAGSDKRWVPDLAAVAQQLNRTRSFAVILTMTISPDASTASPSEDVAFRRILERHLATGKRFLVVPVLTSYGGAESAIAERLQGIPHEAAKSALMPDDRLVAWIVSRTDGK